jgi:sensor histidine kinase regulating citrate/malate metabolism
MIHLIYIAVILVVALLFFLWGVCWHAKQGMEDSAVSHLGDAAPSTTRFVAEGDSILDWDQDTGSPDPYEREVQHVYNEHNKFLGFIRHISTGNWDFTITAKARELLGMPANPNDT